MKMKSLFILVLFGGAQLDFATLNAECNGFAQLCARRYNQVSYAQTHNAQSNTASPVQNQDKSITQQLQDGIRAMKIPVHWDADAVGQKRPMACHGIYKNTLLNNWFEELFNSLPDLGLFNNVIDGMKVLAQPINDFIRIALITAYGDVGQEGAVPFQPCYLDSSAKPYVDILTEIRQFLDANSNEVVTIFIEDQINNPEEYNRMVNESGLQDYIHTQDQNSSWPTLQEMIDSGRRLVMFTDGASGNYPWLHKISDYEFGSDYDFQTKDGLVASMNFSKGTNYQNRYAGQKNKLFMVSHFLTPLLAGSKPAAQEVNERSVLRTRIKNISQAADHLVNYVNVDFYEYPNMDVLDVVNEINGVGKYANQPLLDFSGKW